MLPAAPVRSTHIPTAEQCRRAISLLCDTDFTRRPDTNTWSHHDGHPFTQEEQAAVDLITQPGETEDVGHRARYLEYRRAQTKAQRDLNRFLDPFVERLINKHLGTIVQDMTDAEQAELERLLHAVDGPALTPVRSAF
ncbi:hypothetical protein ACYBSK_36500 [Streptomyces sp. BYX5S]